MPHLYVGTSGFAYPAWKPEFYPQKVPQSRFLEHYGTRLNSVEINYTFRRSASESTLTKWCDQTPEGFRFSVKAHQRITHFARLKAKAAEPTEFFLRSMEPLRAAGRLGAILFQLPPNMKLDMDRLRAFLKLLPDGIQVAFEFRHESWFEEATYAALRDHNAALCQAESDELTVPDVATADFVYMRLRKTAYNEADCVSIRGKVERLLAAGQDVFLYFKHEDTPEGALYAEDLQRSVSTHD